MKYVIHDYRPKITFQNVGHLNLWGSVLPSSLDTLKCGPVYTPCPQKVSQVFFWL